jgi:hypothetical protein
VGEGGEKKTRQAQHSQNDATTTAPSSSSSAPGMGKQSGATATTTTAGLTQRLAMILLACLVAVPSVSAQSAWTPAVCGGARSTTYCTGGGLYKLNEFNSVVTHSSSSKAPGFLNP